MQKHYIAALIFCVVPTVTIAETIEWRTPIDFESSIAQAWQSADIEADRERAEQLVLLRESVDSAANKITTALAALTTALIGLGVVKKLPSGDSDRVNINTATVEQLKTLPGVGLGIARSIVHVRETQGNFSSITNLAAVRSMTPEILEGIRDKITF